MKVLKNKMILICVLLVMTCLVQAGGVQLYAVERDSGNLAVIDQTTGVIVGASIPVTLAGFAVDKGLGLALDPTDFKTVYAVFQIDDATRRLVTLDLNTAVATDVGLLSDQVAGITFDDSGQMYGVVGDGGTESETLFSIDKSDASMTLIVALGDGTDGETIAYNYDNGLLYTRSGNGGAFPDQALTSIDPGNPVPTTIVIASVDGFGEPTGLIYDEDTGGLLEADRSERLMSITTGGVFTLVAPDSSGPTLRGLMFYPSKQDLIFYDGFETAPPPPVR